MRIIRDPRFATRWRARVIYGRFRAVSIHRDMITDPTRGEVKPLIGNSRHEAVRVLFDEMRPQLLHRYPALNRLSDDNPRLCVACSRGGLHDDEIVALDVDVVALVDDIEKECNSDVDLSTYLGSVGIVDVDSDDDETGEAYP